MTMKTIADKYPTKPFSRKYLRSIVDKGEQQHCINYINKYFFKTFEGFLFFDVVNYKTEIKNLNIEKISNYLPRGMKIYDNKGKVSFDVYNWFVNDNDEIFKITFAPGKPVIYSQCDNNFINLFVEPKHELKPYNEYDDETKENVDVILNHIYEVLCDKDETLYTYMLNWFSNLCMYNKNETGLYFKSCKGTGKSIFNDKFLNKNILQHLALTSSDVDIITGYNAPLNDKLLLVLEELPANSKAQWKSFGDKIKDMITNTQITIKEKFKTDIVVPSFLNVIVISNHNALPFTTDQRRFVVAQISDHRVGDFDYFSRLNAAVEDKQTGAAFITYMRHRYESENVRKFPFRTIPKTIADKELHLENLPKHLQFVKDRYIAEGLSFTDTVSDTYEKYCAYVKGNPMSKIIFGKEIRKLGIEPIAKTVNKKSFKSWNTSHKDLVYLFENKGWIHEDDDVDASATAISNVNDLMKELKASREYAKSLEDEITTLEAKLFELKEQLINQS